MASVAVPLSPANPLGLPGYRGWGLLDAPRISNTGESPGPPTSPSPQSSAQESLWVDERAAAVADDRYGTPLNGTRALGPSLSLSSLQSTVIDFSQDDDEEEALPRLKRKKPHHMVFFEATGRAADDLHRCLLCRAVFKGVSEYQYQS